jgi:NAD(P)-dependent dehydrogenase (short-subunit alcohol dehydrogenase family)
MVNVTSQNQLAAMGADSVMLVSGGGRGITAECVLRLAQDLPCKWILLGRSPLVDPDWYTPDMGDDVLTQHLKAAFQAAGEKVTPVKLQRAIQGFAARRDVRRTLQTLADLGRQAEYLPVDITDLAALQAGLAPVVAKMGPVTGLIHGAGNLADKRIENKTEQDFEYVYAAKVTGLEHLLRCVEGAHLQQIVLFSSVAGFYGSAGQSDYAIANEILNKTALRWKQIYPACHVVSINWGPWDSGMVTEDLKKSFRDRQIDIIPIPVGTELLRMELGDRYRDTAQVVIGSALIPQGADLDAELRTYRLRRWLTLEANPFLQDHVIGGNPVLPATCAAAWIINTCEHLYPGYRFFCLENFKVLKGLVFDGSQPTDVMIDVQETAKINDDGIVFDVRIWSEQEARRLRFHYSGQVILRRQLPPVPAYPPPPMDLAPSLDGPSLYHDKTLFHGLAFQGIQRVSTVQAQHLLFDCWLPALADSDQGQFPVQSFNPYTCDVCIQCLLVWLRQVHQVAALPLEIQQITQFQPLDFDCRFQVLLEIQQKTETDVVANMTVFGDRHQIYLRISAVKMTISERLNQLFERLPLTLA